VDFRKLKVQKGQPKINEISDPLILERYVAIADYDKQKKNECSVKAGQTVEVIDKNDNGTNEIDECTLYYGGKEGSKWKYLALNTVCKFALQKKVSKLPCVLLFLEC